MIEEIAAELGNPEARPSGLYMPDEKSKKYTMSFFLHPLLKKYEGYRAMSDNDKKVFREAVWMGRRDNKGIRVAQTVQLYVLYMMKIMGMM